MKSYIVTLLSMLENSFKRFASIASVSIWSIGIIQGCSSPTDSVSNVKNVVTPGLEVSRTLLANLNFGVELGTFLQNFGYIPGANCVQRIFNQRKDGTSFETIELGSGTCRSYPFQDTPLAVFRLRLDNSLGNNSSSYWLSALEINGKTNSNPQAVGRVNLWSGHPNSGVLVNLCDLHFATTCDLVLSNNGAIAEFRLK